MGVLLPVLAVRVWGCAACESRAAGGKRFYIYMGIYVYIYRERERERDGGEAWWEDEDGNALPLCLRKAL